MDKKITGLLGAISSLAAAHGAQAATPVAPSAKEVMAARSYADLLESIPNALALLRADDEVKAEAARQRESRDVKVAQFFYPYHHHHHHHHHHHNHWWGWGPPRPYVYYHHHHHHHHHHHNWAGYDRR